jgi:ankyrin repeat protein
MLGADPSVQDRDGWAPLHLAAGRGHKTIAKLLLEKDADPSLQNSIGETLLHLAASNGHKAIAELLLDKGVDPPGRRIVLDGRRCTWLHLTGMKQLRNYSSTRALIPLCATVMERHR